jgi:protein SCO1
MMPRRSVLVVSLGLFLLALVAGVSSFVLTRVREVGQTQSSSASIGGPFTLVDNTGRTVTDQSFRGKWLLIYFGYTNCPDACPTALTTMGLALKKLGAEADRLQPIFITVDPNRDTVRVLADYLKSFDSRIVGLTGSQEQTESVVRVYRVYVVARKTGGDDYSVDHGAYFYLMNPEGRFRSVIAGDTSGDELAERVRKAMSSWPM